MRVEDLYVNFLEMNQETRVQFLQAHRDERIAALQPRIVTVKKPTSKSKKKKDIVTIPPNMLNALKDLGMKL